MSEVATASITDAATKQWLLNERVSSLRLWATNDERWLPADDDAVVTIGRDPPVSVSGHAAIRLDAPSVSRMHAMLSQADSHWMLRDLRSRNGTSINGAPTTAHHVLPGDIIALGEARLIATSSRVRALRRLWQRYVSSADDVASMEAVDDALVATRRFASPHGSLVLRGRVDCGLARQIHELARGVERPFVPIRRDATPQTSRDIEEHVAAAAHGTLFVRQGQLAAEPQRALLRAVSHRPSVRVIFAAERAADVSHERGVLGCASVVDVPRLDERGHELPTLVRRLVDAWAVRMKVSSDLLRADDWNKLARWEWDGHDDMEKVTGMFVALRHHGKPTPAARALGVSPGWMSQWMSRYAILR
jgi:hypothetical protein